MPSTPLAAVPAIARAAWTDLTAELRRIVGEDLVAIWAYGGTVTAVEEPHPADLDTYVVLSGSPTADTVRAIEGAHATIAEERDVEWDAWYVLEAAARQAEAPRHAFRANTRDTSWAINRAHWLGGRYVLLHGAAPDQIVPPPAWDELVGEMSRELEHIERHVLEGDTDPFEATYAVLNGSRILHALETGSVAVSKAAAGAWALEQLPARWQPAVQAARRAYGGHPTPADETLLATQMAPFVAFVRERLPYPDDRPAGPPRWSGY